MAIDDFSLHILAAIEHTSKDSAGPWCQSVKMKCGHSVIGVVLRSTVTVYWCSPCFLWPSTYQGSVFFSTSVRKTHSVWGEALAPESGSLLGQGAVRHDDEHRSSHPGYPTSLSILEGVCLERKRVVAQVNAWSRLGVVKREVKDNSAVGIRHG